MGFEDGFGNGIPWEARVSRREPEIRRSQSSAYQQGGSKVSIPERDGPSAISPSILSALGGELTTRGFCSTGTPIPRKELPSVLHLGSGG